MGGWVGVWRIFIDSIFIFPADEGVPLIDGVVIEPVAIVPAPL